MANYQFKGLLLNEGWMSPAYVHTDDNGIISYLSTQKEYGVNYEIVEGYAIPGFQNAHSHAFQYAMAGIAEHHKPGNSADDFWSWREAMYKVALSIAPDELQAIAAMLYSEMVQHGYTHVAEFHYLHHDKNGQPYSNLAEMGERLVAASKQAGIKITLVPMFYQQGGFGMKPQDHQRRFISSTIDEYYQLLEATKKAVTSETHATHGFGIHSLRAVHPDDIKSTLREVDRQLPIHIHIAEQLKEIEDAKAYLKARPVEWLLDNNEVNNQYHLVHATHLTEQETKGIAQSGANVVLCPSTEGNLGDGIFPLHSYQAHGGYWSIGTDSHVGLNPLEELRILDYGQRLTSHQRNTFTGTDGGDSATTAYNQSLISGRKAMGNHNAAYFEIGQPLDAAIYDASVPLLNTSTKDNILTSIIYCGEATWNLGTIVNGQWIVKEGIHERKELINKKFIETMKTLAIR